MKLKRMDNGKYYYVSQESISSERLKKIGFKQCGELWTYKFPVKKNKNTTILYATVSLVPTARIFSVDVYESSTDKLYSPWYNCEFGNYNKLINKIDNKVSKKLYNLKIYKIRSNTNAKDSKIRKG